jgi:hypothetical protein
MFRAVPLACLLAVLALPASAEKPMPSHPGGATACADPRPQMCTQNYDPVCAAMKDGSRKTFANGCMACADKGAVSHTPGPCH